MEDAIVKAETECPYKRLQKEGDYDEPIEKRARLSSASPSKPNISDSMPEVNIVNIAPALEPDECHKERMQEALRHFDVLDEVQGDSDVSDADAPDGEYDSSGSEMEGDDQPGDLEEEDIDELLDEGLPECIRNKKVEAQYEEKFKTVLEELDQNHFEILPEGWVQATHNSGMPIYLHTESRVCTASRPYFLGPASVRKHEIPVSAITCLSYRRSLEKELQRLKKLQEATDASKHADPTTAALHPIGTQATIETVRENLINESLTADQLQEYCRTLFRFKNISVRRFTSWQARRKFTKSKKHIQNLQRPTLPVGTKLISFPIPHQHVSISLPMDGSSTSDDNLIQRHRREWIMNPNGKSFVCILHEYVQHALKKQPTYEFKELENAATPYSATVSINDLKYGTGFGTSKKQAKSEAARLTLEVLIPEMKEKITTPAEKSSTSTQNDEHDTKNTDIALRSGAPTTSSSTDTAIAFPTSHTNDVSLFDEIRIEDHRVTEFCSKTTEPLPHSILLTCLQRNYGMGELQVSYQVNAIKHKRNEFTMSVGKHTVTVPCKNKRDGKHRAAQAILQILHPHVRTWGSLLRLYGNHSVKSFKEKKQEEQQITVLQSRAAINQPNYAILDKLRLEMTKMMERRIAVRTIGTFQPQVELPSASSSNLNNVEL